MKKALKLKEKVENLLELKEVLIAKVMVIKGKVYEALKKLKEELQKAVVIVDEAIKKLEEV